MSHMAIAPVTRKSGSEIPICEMIHVDDFCWEELSSAVYVVRAVAMCDIITELAQSKKCSIINKRK